MTENRVPLVPVPRPFVYELRSRNDGSVRVHDQWNGPPCPLRRLGPRARRPAPLKSPAVVALDRARVAGVCAAAHDPGDIGHLALGILELTLASLAVPTIMRPHLPVPHRP